MTGKLESTSLRRELVQQLRGLGLLADPRVADAFLAVPRERFVPEAAERDGLQAVYANNPIATKWDTHGMPTSSSSQPSIMAAMLERLGLHPGHRVLEIGAGTGYNAALLAALVGPAGTVVSVEIDPETAARARAALQAAGSRVQVVVGDGRGGWPQAAPYDRMIVTASSAGVPRAWFDQLRPGGRLVLPLQVSLAVDGVQVVCVLDKERAGFAPAGAICGGFMPLRPRADALCPLPPALAVSEQLDGTGRGRMLSQLSGAALTTMSELARRRLLALILGPARVRRLGRLPRYPLQLFVALATRDDRLTTQFGQRRPTSASSTDAAAASPCLGAATRQSRASWPMASHSRRPCWSHLCRNGGPLADQPRTGLAWASATAPGRRPPLAHGPPRRRHLDH